MSKFRIIIDDQFTVEGDPTVSEVLAHLTSAISAVLTSGFSADFRKKWLRKIDKECRTMEKLQKTLTGEN